MADHTAEKKVVGIREVTRAVNPPKTVTKEEIVKIRKK